MFRDVTHPGLRVLHPHVGNDADADDDDLRNFSGWLAANTKASRLEVNIFMRLLNRIVYIGGSLLIINSLILIALLFVNIAGFDALSNHLSQTAVPTVSLCSQGGCTSPAVGCWIKGNVQPDGDKYYYLPTDAEYPNEVMDTSAGDRWFCSAGEAISNGWKRAP